VVIRRAGFLLDLCGYRTHLKRQSLNSFRLNPLNHQKGVFNAKWRLYINEEVE